MIIHILIISLVVVYFIPIVIVMVNGEWNRRAKKHAFFFWPILALIGIPYVFYYYIRQVKRLDFNDLKIMESNLSESENLKQLTFIRLFKDKEGFLKMETYSMLSNRFNIFLRIKDSEEFGNPHVLLKNMTLIDCDVDDIDNWFNSSKSVQKFNL
jgi:hypothetical protein